MAKLAEKLKVEVARWSQKPYAELVAIHYPHTYAVGKSRELGSYEVEAVLLEKDEDHVHVAIAVSDGGLSSFFPKSSSVIVQSGAIEVTARFEVDPLARLERAWQRVVDAGDAIIFDADDVRRAWATTRYPNVMLRTLVLFNQRDALSAALSVVAGTWPEMFGDIKSLDLSGSRNELAARLDEATWPCFFGMSWTLGDRLADAIRAGVPDPCPKA